MNKVLLTASLFACFANALGQTNNLTGSPYSLFGLGVSSNSNVGINTALGKGGYALSGENFINNLNPASYAKLGNQTVLFDFGFLLQISAIDDGSSSENRIATSFSNLALASKLSPNSAFGLSINPYTDVGYSLIGVESNIEGSFDTFTGNVFGSGSLNDLRFSYGRVFFGKIRVGGYASYLFGAIEETESIDASQDFPGQSTLTTQEQNYYRGGRLGFGLQLDLLPNLTLGGGADLATSLSGKRDRVVQKTLDFVPSIVEEETDEEIDSFYLPDQLNAGIMYRPIEGLGISMDYSLRLWDETDQQDNVGTFVDQEMYAMGVEYVVDADGFKYAERIKYRAGFNYDTGYLEVNDVPIASYTITAGLGIPLGLRSISHFNISYGYQQRGSTTGILIEEALHTVNINFSLGDLWFIKQRIN